MVGGFLWPPTSSSRDRKPGFTEFFTNDIRYSGDQAPDVIGNYFNLSKRQPHNLKS